MKTRRFIFRQNKNYVILPLFYLSSIFITDLPGSTSPSDQSVSYQEKFSFFPFTYMFSITDWKLDTTVANVDLYYKITDCKGANTVFLKFNNRNNYPVNISWKELFVTQQIATKSENIEGEKKLVLRPGETAASNCEDTKNKACIIMAEKAIPSYKATIIDFKFKDINVFATP